MAKKIEVLYGDPSKDQNLSISIVVRKPEEEPKAKDNWDTAGLEWRVTAHGGYWDRATPVE